jgi:hypothetical protein
VLHDSLTYWAKESPILCAAASTEGLQDLILLHYIMLLDSAAEHAEHIDMLLKQHSALCLVAGTVEAGDKAEQGQCTGQSPPLKHMRDECNTQAVLWLLPCLRLTQRLCTCHVSLFMI